jgi:hypothetical protein
MSKKFKKQFKVEELSKKNIIYDHKNFLEKNTMDHTQYFSFQLSDFYSGQPAIFWEKVKQDLNYLLQLPFTSFWATVKFNVYLKHSLESFLKFAKGTEVEGVNKLFFVVFCRIALHQEENSELSDMFDIKNEIYEQWLFDAPKFFDLIQIFPNNRQTVKKIIDAVFTQDYVKNYEETITIIEKKIFTPALAELSEIT